MQFPLHEVGRMRAGDFPGQSMAGVARMPLRETLGMRYDHKDMRDLTESVRDQGVHTPLVAFRNDQGRHEIIDGVHRYIAARRSGTVTHLPVRFIDPSKESLA